MDTVLRSRSKTVTIGSGQPFCVIGERINPTGRKLFAEQLKSGDLSTVADDAVAQAQAGADMLDINAGIPLVDEPELLKSMLRTAQDAVDLPICIDSSVIEALEAGLSVYEGRALVNSVTAEDERLEEILPLVARHGAAVIALVNDETGIPETPQQRLGFARKIVECGARPRHRAAGRSDRSAGHDRRCRHRGGDHDARDDSSDPRRAGRQHVPGGFERLLWSPAAPCAERGASCPWPWPPG